MLNRQSYNRVIKTILLSSLAIIFSISSAFAEDTIDPVEDYNNNVQCGNFVKYAEAGTLERMCEFLGYISDKSSNCLHYLRCPFNTDFVRCVKRGADCSSFSFKQCPEHGTCDPCANLASGDLTFKLTGCTAGYELSPEQNACQVAACPEGSSVEYTSEEHCPLPEGVRDDVVGRVEGWSVDQTPTGYSGDQQCWRCLCTLPEDGSCKWKVGATGSQKHPGDADIGYELTDLCCDGSYKTCTRRCYGYNLKTKPDETYAVVKECTGCDEGTTYMIESCKSGYVLSGSQCKAPTCPPTVLPPCAVGDVYYSDGTCSPDYNPDDTTKIPVGVVFYVKDDCSGGKIINLHDLYGDGYTTKFNPAKPYTNKSFKQLEWGLDNVRTSLTQYTSQNQIENEIKNGNLDAEVFNGKENTQTLLNTVINPCQVGSTTAAYGRYCISILAQAATTFYPYEPATEDENGNPIEDPTLPVGIGAGNWYLPAIGELYQVYGMDIGHNPVLVGTTRNLINTTLKMLKDAGVVAEPIAFQHPYWSSSDSNKTEAWTLQFNNGEVTKVKKDEANNVRVIKQFTIL